MKTDYPNVRVKLDKGAYMPVRAHDTDAGADLRCPDGFVIPPRSNAVLHTGVHVETPPNCVTLIKSKSGLNVNHDITAEGVIDEGYDGEIVVKLYNHGEEWYTFNRGDKVCQILIMPVLYPNYISSDEIEGGERGSDGMGSTGR